MKYAKEGFAESYVRGSVSEVTTEDYEEAENVMFDLQIHTADGRWLYRMKIGDDQRFYVLNHDVFELYDPVKNLLWEDKIKRIREVFDTKSYQVIEGTMVDLFSASAIIKVYDNINLKNKLRFLSNDIPDMVEIAFRALRRARSENA